VKFALSVAQSLLNGTWPASISPVQSASEDTDGQINNAKTPGREGAKDLQCRFAASRLGAFALNAFDVVFGRAISKQPDQ
jgi:hypothetical protein